MRMTNQLPEMDEGLDSVAWHACFDKANYRGSLKFVQGRGHANQNVNSDMGTGGDGPTATSRKFSLNMYFF